MSFFLLVPVANTNSFSIQPLSSVPTIISPSSAATSNSVHRTEKIPSSEPSESDIVYYYHSYSRKKAGKPIWNPPPKLLKSSKSSSPAPDLVEPENYEKFVQASREVALDNKISFNCYCSRFVKQRLLNGDKTISCNICGFRMILYGKSSHFRRCRFVADHVRKHLGKLAFSCKLCNFSSATVKSVQYHLRKRHGLERSERVGRSEILDTSDTCTEELIDLVDRCYSKKDDAGSSNDTENISSFEYCQGIFDRLSQKVVRCRICNYSSSLFVRDRALRAFEHVLGHFGISGLVCRLCNARYPAKSSIMAHMKKKHNQKAFEFVNYDGDADENAKQVKAMLDYCFGGVDDLEKLKSILPGDIVDHLKQGRRKMVFRYCRTLAKKFSKSSRLACRLCSKSIQTSSERHCSFMRFAVDHATEHLGKRMYHCRYCPKRMTGMQPICMHVHHCHRKSATDGYTDHSDAHHYEILRWVTKCFDWDQKKDGVSKFGLEESDEDDAVEEKKNIDDEDPKGRKYNLRPRAAKESVQKGKRFLKFHYFFKLKMRYQNGQRYQCRRCGYKSQYHGLVVSHMRIMHNCSCLARV